MSIDEQLTELEEKLKLQDNKITDLKANVKWLYKYGGSGTGSGGGSGSTSTKTPSLVYSSSTGNISAELGSTTSNTRIVTEGSQNLSFFLRYLNTEHAYKVSYSSNDGISWSTIAISDDNTFTIPLNITGNINIRVRLQDITDNSNGPAALALSFITTPITITTYLVGENAGGSQTIAGEIFMQNYTKIWAVMDVVPHIAGSFTATSDALPETFSLDEMEVDKTYTSKQLLYDTEFLSDTSNVGAYSLKYSTEFTSDLSGIQTNELEEAFTLIPNSTYAVVTAEGGSIYTSKPDSNYYEFSAGAITFTGRIYKGSADGETFQKVTAELYNDQGENLYTFPISTPVTERANFLTGTVGTFYFSNELITADTGNWFEIRLTIAQNSNDTPQVQSYYLFVKKNENVLKWYPDTIVGEWYFNKENKSSDVFPQSTSEISCYLSTDPVSYSWENDLTVNTPESQIAIAFNLEEGNDDVQLAALTTTVGDETKINIYQNKIELGSDSRTIDIYLPMDNTYHLLQIYGRIVAMANANTPLYEWVAYIDGVIEGALASFIDFSFKVNGITLNPGQKGVFSTNHFNYTVFDCSVYKRWDNKYPGMNDSNVTEYYYKYLCTTNTVYKEENYAAGMIAFNAIKYTYDSSTHEQEYLTKLSAAEVTTLQDNGGLPVLVFRVKQEGLKNILTQMETTYGEEKDPGAIQLEDIQYYEAGNKEAKNCKTELDSAKYFYTIKIQGSSTKGYKFKNWELGIDSSENEIIPIFSLDYGEEGGFFPEQSFTLKGDIVDSSHCVNTAVGDFVNANCTPFNTGYQNCLSGKPLLVLVEHISEEAAASEYYLLGIYNYNLGRNSKYNLNYAERPSLSSDLSGFIVATTSSTQTKATYASAEIANNSCFWDFSQYDSSILFENQYKMDDGLDPTPDFLKNNEDTYYMWGDLVYAQGFPINEQIQKCVKGVSRAGGFLFDWMKKSFSKDAYFTELSASSSSKAWKEINTVPDSKHQYLRKIKYDSVSKSYTYTFTPATNAEADYTQQDLIDCIYGRTDEEGNVTAQPYINYNSVMEYYVIMQAFGLVDSPMKNLNLKTWNYSEDKGSTFCAAFYDMDTGFGGDNAGSITITPFAFSDYWETNETGLVTRHLDYWPESNTEIGFDVPSSFLFAIGKYAEYYRQANLQEEYAKLLSPMEFWAKLRQPEGNLRNADYFVNNYLNKKFTNTHPMIWNMNYRSKYLIQGEKAYDNTQFNKFHGRRLNRTKAWLNNRLHMLDAYFNVNNLAYTAENNSDVSLKIQNPDTAVSTLQNNSDVIILQNIFADGGKDAIKTNSSISCNVKTLNYSPFIAQSTNSTGAMRLFNSGKEYTVSIAVTGNQSIFPYGCSRWTSMDSVNSFIQNSAVFYMKNDYMTNLLCDKTYTTAFSPSSWELHTPKMQKVEITGSSFKGALQIYPGNALTYLDLSNTAITFKTQGADGDYNVCPNLKTLKLNSFKGSVTLNNCNMLENIEVNEATLESLEINPYQGDCSFTKTNIKSIKIVSTSENATFSLINDSTVQSITLSGFKTVKISGCNALKDINLVGDLPTTLCVDSCYGGGISFPEQTTNKVVDFSGVETLSLNTTKFDESAITTIKADKNLTSIDAQCVRGSEHTSNITFDLTKCNSDLKANFWNSYAKEANFKEIYIDESSTRFRGSSLESITGTLIINHNGGYSFQNCTKLTTLGKVEFAKGVTNAESTFQYCHSLTSISALTINTPLTNIERMCEWIAYTSSTIFANALKNSVSSVTNMHGCFQGSSITDYSAFLDLDWTGVTTKESILGACNSNVSALSTTITQSHLTFTNASTVDPLCIFQPTTTYSESFRVTTTIPFNIDSLGGTKTESLDFSYIIVKGINSTNFLTNASECKKVSNLEFVKNTSLVFGDNNHITSFYRCIQDKTNHLVTTDSTNNFFKNFTSIISSLNALSISGDLNIANFVDYSNLKTSDQLFSEDFNITKVISQNDFANLVNTIFDSSGTNNLTTVQGVFKNCTITCDASCMETNTLEVSIPSNSKVTNISNLFYNCHAFYTDEESVTHRIYLKFMSGNNEGFSNLTNLHICTSAWEDCYLNKLTETWFANTEKALTNCSYAFKFAQFNQRYSDDSSDKIAYVVDADIYIGNQTNKEVSGRSATTLNSTIAEDFYNGDGTGHYILPNNFFYYEDSGNKIAKVSAQFNGTEMFMGSSLYGMLPESLFATNSKPSTNCSSMFKFCTLIPYYVGSKYQTLIPSTWSYSLGSDASREILQYTTFKVDIYCIVPNGTEDTPYLTGAMGDTLAGAIIVPTIHQDGDTPVSWGELWDQLHENSENYINPTFASEPSGEDAITIGTIDFIYQYNQYSLDQTSNDYKNLLPISLGISEEYITTYDTLDFRLHVKNIAWDVLPDYTGYSLHGYLLNWAYNYQPATYIPLSASAGIEYSDELYKIHIGTQYNGGDTLLFVDDTNTDGFTTSSTKNLTTTGLINDKVALLLYGPIFNKDVKIFANINDDDMCSKLMSFQFGAAYRSPATQYGDTTDPSESGKRFYHKASTPTTLYAYDLSRNLKLPAASKTTQIKSIIKGEAWRTSGASQTSYKCYRYYNSRGSGNFINYVERYQ